MKILENVFFVIILTNNGEKGDPPSEDIGYSKELYQDTSKRLNKAYIVMSTFIVVFFFGAFIPYIDLQHQLETSVSDKILNDLTELSRLASEQENLSITIQNHFDTPTLAAIKDYQRLDDYFRRLELLQSEDIASSNNLSVNQLETIVPTFLVCNQKFHKNVNDWVICNGEICC